MPPLDTARRPQASDNRAVAHLIAADDAMKDFADDHGLTSEQRKVFDTLRSGADLICQAALVVASGSALDDAEFKDLYGWAAGKMIEVERLLPPDARVASPQWERVLATPRLVGNLSDKDRPRSKGKGR